MSLTGSLSNKPGTASIGTVTPISHAFAAVLAPMPRRLEPSSPRLYLSGTTLFFHDQWLLTKTKMVDRPFKSIEDWANNVTISPSATTTTSQTSSSCEHGEKALVKSEPHRLYSVPSWLCKKYPTLDLNLHLPPGAENNNRFRRVFIPTFERWFGTRANPWVVSTFVAIPVLQTIWDAVYMADGIEWTFEANDPVIYCISQCLDEWRASFKSTAEIMVEEFLESSGESLKSSDARQEWAANMLHNFKFVFGEDEKGKRRLMHSPFIVRVFAAHLVRIAGAIDIDPAVEGVSSTQKYPPRGALALATAAVERVLQLWANGEMDAPVTVPSKRKFKKTYMKAAPRLNPADGDISKFSSDVWAAPTTNYYKSIAKMKPGSLEAIVKAANTFLSQARLQVQGSSVGAGSIAEDDGDDDDDDLRACLVDDSDLGSGSE